MFLILVAGIGPVDPEIWILRAGGTILRVAGKGAYIDQNEEENNEKDSDFRCRGQVAHVPK